jgi:acyl-CoA thioester hydrolase
MPNEISKLPGRNGLSAIHRFRVPVRGAAIDANGHANNVEYVRWMQQAAISHSDLAGCTIATKASDSSWVVRSHYVEYLRPAFAGDELLILTWVSTMRKASSLRKYLFLRKNGRAVLARGETNWVLVDNRTGRPKPIPREISSLFEILPPEREPSTWE